MPECKPVLAGSAGTLPGHALIEDGKPETGSTLTPAEDALTAYLAMTPDAVVGVTVRDLTNACRRGVDAERRLAEIRKLAESLGDRSGPADTLPARLPLRDAGRYSDRRLMEPLKRMLLEILDRPRLSEDFGRAPVELPDRCRVPAGRASRAGLAARSA